MTQFDFIAAPQFRASLEADYAEMHRCAKAEAWKSVHVLAGSIIEALLIDYLVATNTPARPGKDLLKTDLAEAINICRDENLLNQRTADLSSVIRSFRNLIHPGRVLRLAEEQPTEESATIALKLVDIITTQVVRKRRETFGFTAEQLLSKLERDENAIPILKHLLTDVDESQRERLLLDLIPQRYLALTNERSEDDEPFSAASVTISTLKRAYRILYDASGDSARKKAAERFTRVLREEDGETVNKYRTAFFVADDLRHVAESQRPLVKQHVLSADFLHDAHSAERMKGIESFLTPEDMRSFLDPFVRSLASSRDAYTKRIVRKQLVVIATNLSESLVKAFNKRIDEWMRTFDSKKQEPDLIILRELKAEIDGVRALL